MKNKGLAKFGGQIGCIVGDVQVANERNDFRMTKSIMLNNN